MNLKKKMVTDESEKKLSLSLFSNGATVNRVILPGPGSSPELSAELEKQS